MPQEKLLLSIVIPTYNRFGLLSKTLDALIKQPSYQVEIIVCDNCSKDDTPLVEKIYSNNIKYYRHKNEIPGDANISFCYKQGIGSYIWVLCDDDLPADNAVEEILKVVQSGNNPGLININAIPSDKNITNYRSQKENIKWSEFDKNSFLYEIGDKLTFVSSVIPRRDVLETSYIDSTTKLSLVAVGVNLSAAGNSNKIMMPDKPLLYMRGGNAGGYDAYTVFSKYLSIALTSGEKKYGFHTVALESVYRSSLSGVMPYIISVWPMNKKGIINLIRYSILYKEFYTHVIPAFFKKIKKW